MNLIPHVSIVEILQEYKNRAENNIINKVIINNDFPIRSKDEISHFKKINPKEFLKHCLKVENRLFELSNKIKKDDNINLLKTSVKIVKYLQFKIRTPTVYESVQQMVDMRKVLANYEELCKIYSGLIKLESFKLVEKQDKLRMVCDTSPRPRGMAREAHYKAQSLFKGSDLNSVSEELVFRVYFYDPVRGSRIAGFDILGCQTLADLRDSFVCLRNQIFCDSATSGSCFLINGILYPDTRNPTSHEYHLELIDYLTKYNPKLIRSTEPISQHNAIINNIEVPINSNGVYLHSGDCEHRMMFTSVRLISKSDSAIKSTYPLCIYKPITRMEMCEICKKNSAKSMVFNCKLLIKNPMSLCSVCIDNFLYKDDELVDPNTAIFKME